MRAVDLGKQRAALQFTETRADDLLRCRSASCKMKDTHTFKQG